MFPNINTFPSYPIHQFEIVQTEKELAVLSLYESAQKNPEDAYQLGKMYLDQTQEMVDPDVKEAIRHFEMAYANGHSGAAFELGCIYREGRESIAEDLLKSEQYLMAATKAGFPGAATVLGQIYLVGGKGVEQDIKTAKSLFDVDADQHHHAQAFIELGRMHRDGLETTKDAEKAKLYFQMGIDKNNPEAMTEMGKMIREEGEDMAAKQLFEQALSLSHFDAGTELGCLYRDGGNGIEQNFYAAENYFDQGIKTPAKRRSYAAHQIALIAAEKVQSYDHQFRHHVALRYFEHAIMLGNKEAPADAIRIGNEYLKQNPELASKYLKIAAAALR